MPLCYCIYSCYNFIDRTTFTYWKYDTKTTCWMPPGMLHGPLQWRHDGRDGVSNHRRPYCLLNCFFRRRSKETSKLCVTGRCEGNSPVTSEFPAQRASNAENVSIWWRHHAMLVVVLLVSTEHVDQPESGASSATRPRRDGTNKENIWKCEDSFNC